jgi:hypothetical protein
VARVEKLSTQVKNMSTRIRELEAALGEAQTHIGKQGHPLLATAVKWEEPDDVGLPPESDGESANGMQFFDEAEDEAEEDSLQVWFALRPCAARTSRSCSKKCLP